MYVHCLYFNKWPKLRYIFNNLIIFFHCFLHWMNWQLEVSIQRIWPLPGPKDINKMSALAANVPGWLKEIPEHLRTPEVLNETVCNNPFALRHVPDCLKTQKVCDDVVGKCPRVLQDVPDHLKTEKMCNKVVWRDPFPLQFDPDLFVIQQQLKLWHYYDDNCLKNAYCLASITLVELVHPWRREKRDKNFFLIIWYAEIKIVLIKEDAQIWSERDYS